MDENKKVWVKPDRRMTMDELWARFTNKRRKAPSLSYGDIRRNIA